MGSAEPKRSLGIRTLGLPWKEHFFDAGPEPGDDKLAGRLPSDFDVKCHGTSLENVAVNPCASTG
jgi:hypothetical protein